MLEGCMGSDISRRSMLLRSVPKHELLGATVPLANYHWPGRECGQEAKGIVEG
jgi:hypothetical protein